MLSVPELDLQIIFELSLSDFSKFSRISRDIYDFCSDDYVWKIRLDLDLNNLSQYRPFHLTHRQQYQDILKMDCDRAILEERMDGLEFLQKKIVEEHLILAAKSGSLKSLQWMHSKGITVDLEIIKIILEHGHLEIIKWLDSVNNFTMLFQNTSAANWACLSDNIEIMFYLNAQGIFPDLHGANWAAQKGNLKLVRLLEGLGIHHDQTGIDWAALYGHIDFLEEYSQIRPSQIGVNWAAQNGHIHVLEYLELIGINSNQDGANLAALQNRIDVLNWLEERKILPNYEGANSAIWERHSEVLDWLDSRNIYPSVEIFIAAAVWYNFPILEFMMNRGYNFDYDSILGIPIEVKDWFKSEKLRIKS